MAWFRKSPALPYFLDPKSRPTSAENVETKAEALGAVEGDAARYKLNHVMVGMQPMASVDVLLRRFHYGIRYAKLLSVCFQERRGELRDFAKLSNQNGILPYVGGGATEDAMKSGSLYTLTRTLHRAGIDTIEVSNSVGDLPTCRVGKDIEKLRNDFAHVLVEIGPKGSAAYRSTAEWTDDLDAALALNPEAVILEGTNSGRSGIYNARTSPRTLLAHALMERAGAQRDRLLVEAPLQDQRMYWIFEHLGWNAQLGNIWLDAEALENMDTMRLRAMKPEAASAIQERSAAQQMLWQEVQLACSEIGVHPDTVVFSGQLDGFTANMFDGVPRWRESLRANLRRLVQAPMVQSQPVVIDLTGLLMVLRRLNGGN